AKKSLALIAGLTLGAVQEQKPQDWDAEWKASFQGAEIPPFWKIVPPWEKESPPPQGSTGASKRLLRINPGAGFGTGTHETTQLCLQAIGELPAVTGARALDFGSGSGILSIGAAILGYEVDAVEIDPLAIDNATENARLNEMEARIHFSRELPEAPHRYPLVVANILKPVLLEFARTLTERLDPRGTLVLSGLIDQDVAPVGEAFSKLLSGKRPEIRERGEWRALVWRLT
ncbi:MAG: 50S ribosomal protein L11 methyltransferase, partial [Bdellovibrionota bacterium]